MDGSKQIVDLLPEKIVDDEAALRREERRRVAAQEAAARARVEMLGLADELARERAAKAAVTSESARLRSELDDLRQRLREAQRAEHATAQALAKAEAELVDLRRSAAPPLPPQPVIDARPPRDCSRRQYRRRPTSSACSPKRWASSPLPTPGQRRRGSSRSADRARRKPMRLPGGVFTGTVEAAEFLFARKSASG